MADLYSRMDRLEKKILKIQEDIEFMKIEVLNQILDMLDCSFKDEKYASRRLKRIEKQLRELKKKMEKKRFRLW